MAETMGRRSSNLSTDLIEVLPVKSESIHVIFVEWVSAIPVHVYRMKICEQAYGAFYTLE